MSHLRIALLGGFRVTLAGRPIEAFSTDKARALLAYLAIEARRSHRRSDLAALLWPETTEKKATHNLSQTLLRLRRALNDDAAASEPFLRLAGQEVQFNLASDHSLDAADFQALIQAQARHHPDAGDDCAACIGWLQQAIGHYRGDFLAGFSLRASLPFEEWHTVQQQTLHIQALDALTHIMAFYERRRQPDLVCDFARHLLALEPWHEQAQLELMKALAECGQETAALEQFVAYRRLLEQEFGMAPATEIEALAERIRARTQITGATSLADVGQSARQTTGNALSLEYDERRQVTALVCGWNPTEESADGEDQIEAFVSCRMRCIAILERFGAWLPPQQGATCLAYFGYPVAFEDTPRRAAQAALTIAAEQPKTMRIGLHTGVMTVRQGELLGNTPDLAHSCQRLAAPGSVWLTEESERLLQGWFDCEAMGRFALVEKAGDAQFYRLRGAITGGNRLIWLAQRARLIPLVGRTSEIEQLAASLAAVQREGCGCVVALCGDAGLGKSRLVWELKQRSAGDCDWLETRCLPYFEDTSLHPVIGLFEQFFEFEQVSEPENRLAALERTLVRMGLAQAEIIYPLALLLGLPTNDGASHTISEEQRQQMRLACVALLTQAAAQRPMTLVIEDLHWADPSTLAWVGASLTALSEARCLTLLTMRPTFKPDWLSNPHVRQIELGPLTAEQIETMAVNLAGARSLSLALRQQVAAQANGIPLFAEELTQFLLEKGASVWPSAIPATLSDLLQARLDQVGAARETAGWAAALGREFSGALLAAVTPMGEQRLQAQLAALTAAGLLTPTADGAQPHYAFRHSLIQDAAYAALSRRTRQAHHRRIAQVYATRFPAVAQEQPEILAHHYAQAGLRAEATELWLQAGDHAAVRGANQEACAFFTRALAALEPQDHERRWRATAAREAALFLIGDRAAQQADIEALLALATEAGRPLWRAEALLRQLRQLNSLADYTAMPPLAEEIERLAQTAGDSALEARALCLHASALTRLGAAAARATAERALAFGRRAGDEGSVAYAVGTLALQEAYAGDYARAAVRWTEALELVRRTGDRTLESRALSNLGAAFQYLGLFDEARTYLEQGIALCALTGDRQSRAYNLVNLGGVLLMSGDLTAARRLIEQGLGEATVLDDAYLRAGQLWELGRLEMMTGTAAEAAVYLEEARRIYRDHDMTAGIMETNALLAQSALAQGRPQEAYKLADEVWRYLREEETVGMDEALSTYLTLADVFEALTEGASDAPGAQLDQATVRAILQKAHTLVMARAGRISDPHWRRSFLENVPANRAAVLRWLAPAEARQ